MSHRGLLSPRCCSRHASDDVIIHCRYLRLPLAGTVIGTFEYCSDVLPTPDNCTKFEVTVRVEKPKIMNKAKKKVDKLYRKKSSAAVEKLGFQGEMLQFLGEEERDIAWKSTIFKVLRGVMAWAVRAGTNSLASPDNLARWDRPVDSRCSMDGCDISVT